MEKTDIVIIGAGVVGLAIARQLSAGNREILLLERHDGFGREASSRNSEVIHAGIYYPADSLKAQLCVEGNALMRELCAGHGIPHAAPGKIIVATGAEEIDKLEQLLEQGRRNGVQGLRLMTKAEVLDMEPDISAEAGLWSPNTGIMDSHSVMNCFARSASDAGVTMAYGCEMTGVEKTNDGFLVRARDTDGETLDIGCEWLMNAAGLESGSIAAMAGVDIDSAGYRIHPCKGEYFAVADRHRGRISHLIYPPPTAISLGVHSVLKLDGGLKLGPNAFYVDSVNYDVDPGHQRSFFEIARKYLPFIEYEDLQPDMAGIRAKLQAPDDPFRDFIIAEESGRGLPGLINLAGLESPALTASIAIARRVEALLA